MRPGIGGALVRAVEWASLASLCSLLVALLVGVGGFRILDTGGSTSPVRISRAVSPPPAGRTGTSPLPEIAPPTRDVGWIAGVTDARVAQALIAGTSPAGVVAPAPAALTLRMRDVPSQTAARGDVTAQDVQAQGAQVQHAVARDTETEAQGEATQGAQAQAPDGNVQSAAQQLSTAAPPDLRPGDRVTVPVSFYYCQDGPGNYPLGDGGGFCGVMRDGTHVYSGAAACAYRYLGQLFKILGDPTHRIYKCADTGSAIHGLHRDIWFANSDDGWVWQHEMGPTAVIEILP